MAYHPRPRYCARRLTRLALDNADRFCAACRSKASDELLQPPSPPRGFWLHAHLQDALESWHFGRLIAAYRSHPHHGRVLTQEAVAGWLNLTQAQLSRIEGGRPPEELSKLIHWAVTLGVPSDLLWFKLPREKRDRARGPSARGAARLAAGDLREASQSADSAPDARSFGYAQEAASSPSPQPTPRDRDAADDDMNRRELLRLLSTVGVLVGVPEMDSGKDAVQAGPEAIADCERLTPHLWQAFSLSKSKRAVFPIVRQQLGLLVEAFRQPHNASAHKRLCVLTGDLFQLAGEIFFDSNRYTDAAYCYTLAADASKEAGAYDLWACALTRHAFIGMYERRFSDVVPILDAASAVAQRGDSQLSTRHWVSAVQAQAFAGLGDMSACTRALDKAQAVQSLTSNPHHGGWLRFDGSRLAEERGSCYTALGRPDLAEEALSEALTPKLSMRRKASVLTDLASLGVQRNDSEQVVAHATAALELAAHTGSGYVSMKLRELQNQLVLLANDHRIRELRGHINALDSVN
jgi:transcriptional regulator with XRE-family HTH domain